MRSRARSLRATVGFQVAMAVVAGSVAVLHSAAPAAASDGPPVIDADLPQVSRTAGGTPIRIYGSGFLGTTSVTFGGVAALKFKVIDGTLITAVTPPGSNNTAVNIAVTDEQGTGTSDGPSNQVLYTNATITVTPNAGLTAGTSVTVSGAGYLANTQVVIPLVNPLVGIIENPPPWVPDGSPPPYSQPLVFPTTDGSGNFSTSFNLPAFTGTVPGYDPNNVCPVTQAMANVGLDKCMLVYNKFSLGSIEKFISYAGNPVPAPPTVSLSQTSVPAGGTVNLSGVNWSNSPFFGSSSLHADPGETNLLVDLCNASLTSCSAPLGANAAVGLTRYFDSSPGQPVQGVFTGATLTGSVTVGNAACAPTCTLRVRQEGYNYEAYNGAGTGTYITATAPLTVTGGSPPGGVFKPLPPTRILDTRFGPGPVGALGPGATLDLQITGNGGIPASGVSAVVFNVTAVNPSASGYLTVYPTGSARPTSANLNYGAGEAVPNLVEVSVGTGGKVSLYNGSGGSTDYVVDVAGWVTTSASGLSVDGRYNPLSPARILDTRPVPYEVNSTGTPLHQSPDLSLQVTGKGGVPATGVSAVVLNVAITNPNASGYLTVYPTGGSAPLAANLNFVAGQTVSNRVVVAVGAGGAISFHLGGAATSIDVIADVSGWFTDATSTAGGSLFNGLTPNRVADTRPSSQVGPKNTPLGPGQTMTVTVAGTPGVPAMGASNAPKAVVFNVAVTNTTASSYLTVYPSGEAQPTAADLNWAPGSTRSNLVVAKIGANGAVNIFNGAGNADVIVDVLGWYA